jgi:enoyl-CoA hydratase/carnithine racemase
MNEPSDNPAVLYERQGALAWISLNRPEALNAVNSEIRELLPRAVERAEADPEVQVVVLRGAAERAFCAGADIKEFQAPESVVQARQLRVHGHWLQPLGSAVKPSVAAIHGFCLGAGLEVALACDIRVAADDAHLGLPEVGLGIIPGSGGTQRLSRLVGLGHALHLILSGERIDADEAYRIGLVSQVVRRGQLMAEVERLASGIASHAPLALALAKEAVHRGYALPLPDGLRLEGDLAALLLTSEDRLEAAAAFREKRRPQFRGR